MYKIKVPHFLPCMPNGGEHNAAYSAKLLLVEGSSQGSTVIIISVCNVLKQDYRLSQILIYNYLELVWKLLSSSFLSTYQEPSAGFKNPRAGKWILEMVKNGSPIRDHTLHTPICNHIKIAYDLKTCNIHG